MSACRPRSDGGSLRVVVTATSETKTVAAGIEANGEILSLDEMAEVPAGRYDDVLLTKDTITIEPDVLEYKLYAPGVGPVLALAVSGGSGREELVELSTVSPEISKAAGTTPLGKPYE